MSENRTTQLAGITKLVDTRTYIPWRSGMKSHLLVIGADDIVYGRDEKPKSVQSLIDSLNPPPEGPSPGSEGSKDIKPFTLILPTDSAVNERNRQITRWEDKDKRARGDMLATIHTSFKMSVEDCESANEMWLAIEALHSIHRPDLQNSVMQDISNLRFIAGGDPLKHLKKFQTLVQTAKVVGVDIPDINKCNHFLSSLPASVFSELKLKFDLAADDKRKFSTLLTFYTIKISDMEQEVSRDAAAAFYNSETPKNNSRGRGRGRGGRSSNSRGRGGQGGSRPANAAPATPSNSTRKASSDDRKTRKSDECFNCKKKGHWADECRSAKKADSVGGDFAVLLNNANLACIGTQTVTNSNAEKTGILFEETALITSNNSRNIDWILDSGATSNVVNNRDYLMNIESCNPRSFRTANGIISATEKGTVIMSSGMDRHGKEKRLIGFAEVYYLPQSPTNLLSWTALLKRGWSINPTLNGGSISRDGSKLPLQIGNAGNLWVLHMKIAVTSEDMNGRHVLLPVQALQTTNQKSATPSGGVPPIPSQLEQQAPQTQKSTSQVPTEDPTTFPLPRNKQDTLLNWHERLGHMGISGIKKLHTDEEIQVTDLESSKFKSSECDVCAVGKATRLSFGNINIRATTPLEIIHSDIAGPLKPSHANMTYYVTFIDDYTGLVCALAIPNKNKHSVFDWFKKFQSTVERSFDLKIKVLRTDNGGEYLNDLLTPYLLQQGIIHQTTTVYTPQLNGVAERWNRTIKEMAGCMLNGSGLDMRYWSFALAAACNILNSRYRYKNKPMLQYLTGHAPSLGNFMKFGCKAWYHIPKEKRLKNDLTTVKALEVRYLGFNTSGSGY